MKNIRLFYIIISLSILAVSCQPILEQRTPSAGEMDSLRTITARLTMTPEIRAKEVCSIVYDEFVLGKTSISKVEEWLQSQGIGYSVSENGDQITWASPEYISLSLFFHDDILYGAELWKTSSRPLMGQVVNGLGDPEYFFINLAKNATPIIGGCEDGCVVVVIILGYPSQGVQFSTLFSTTKATLVITPDIEMEMIECFEPGRRRQFEQNRYGSVLSYSQGMQWQGFGMKVPISRKK